MAEVTLELVTLIFSYLVEMLYFFTGSIIGNSFSWSSNFEDLNRSKLNQEVVFYNSGLYWWKISKVVTFQNYHFKIRHEGRRARRWSGVKLVSWVIQVSVDMISCIYSPSKQKVNLCLFTQLIECVKVNYCLDLCYDYTINSRNNWIIIKTLFRHVHVWLWSWSEPGQYEQ